MDGGTNACERIGTKVSGISSAGTYNISPLWNGLTLIIWTSVGNYTFNLTKDVDNNLPVGFTVRIIKMSGPNTISLVYGSSSQVVQIYRTKDNKSGSYGTLSFTSLCGYLTLTKVTSGDKPTYVLDSNMSF